jgi:hypothetical protein
VPDSHSHPDHHNKRADYLAQLIIDERPDVVVHLGDAADMPSLSSYDKGKRSFQGRSYRADINTHLEFQSRMWDPVRARKKKLPHRVVLEGNHEHRVERALDLSPELTGTIGFRDFDFDAYYDDVVRYDGGTPGVIELDGILFAHYFITGVSGRPIGGERPAHMLLDKTGTSCIAGHLHTFDYAVRQNINGRVRSGLIAGCYQDYDSDWAGNISHLWRRGVAVLDNVENGDYDLTWVSIKALERAYGDVVQRA